MEPFELDTFCTTTQEVSRQIFVVWLDYFCFLVFRCPSTYRIRNSFFIIMIFSFFSLCLPSNYMTGPRTPYYEEENRVNYLSSYTPHVMKNPMLLCIEFKSRKEGPVFERSCPISSSNKCDCTCGTTAYNNHPSFGGSFIVWPIWRRGCIASRRHITE